jgi:hypothetical protein
VRHNEISASAATNAMPANLKLESEKISQKLLSFNRFLEYDSDAKESNFHRST